MQSKRIVAFLTYIPIVGWLLAWATGKDNHLAVFHAKQSVALFVVALLTPILWLAFAWAFTVIPFVGPVISAGSFAMVIITFLYLFVMWVLGLVFALQAKFNTLPLINNVAKRIFK